MVCTRRVTTDAHSADNLMIGVVQGQPATKHIHATNSSADHPVVWLAVITWVAAIRDVGAHRVAFLEAEETAARLHCGEEIGGRQREVRQAERVRCVRL